MKTIASAVAALLAGFAVAAELDLAGTWTLTQADKPSVTCPVAVPGGIYTALYEAKLIPDPYFAQNEDVPIYFKLRTILLQTLADIERRNLQAAGRDVHKEVEVRDETAETGTPGALDWGQLAADATSPLSRVDRNERHALLRAAVAALPENDRAIIVLRHFDGMGNSACAAALGIEPKAASIRYVRALERLQKKLMEVSCFKKMP